MSAMEEDPYADELLSENIFRPKSAPGHMGNVSVVRIKAAHHKLAMLCSTGASNIDVAREGGYTPQYISNLRTANPAFMELVSHYTRKAEAEMLDLRAKQARVGELAVDELTDRLTEMPDQFSVRELLDVVEVNANKPRVLELQKGWSSGPPSPITIQFVTADQGSAVINNSPLIEGDTND